MTKGYTYRQPAKSDCGASPNPDGFHHRSPYPSPARSDPGLSPCSHSLLNTSAHHSSSSLGHLLPQNINHWNQRSLLDCDHSPSMLSERMASVGLQIDLGNSTLESDADTAGISTCYPGSENTLLTRHANLRTPPTFGPVNLVPSTTVSFEQSHELLYDDTPFAPSPETWSSDPTPPPAEPDNCSSAENKFYDLEPCHLAISQDEEASSNMTSLTTCTGAYSHFEYAEIEQAMPPQIKFEENESCRDSTMTDTNSMSEDLDYCEFIQDESPEPKRQKTLPEEARYICPICSKPFSRTFNYNTHLETHDPYRERPYQCTLCYKSFFRPTDLKRHEQSVSLAISYFSSHVLILQQVHLKSKAFTCEQCGAGFPRKDSLQRHRTDGCARRLKIKRTKANKKRKQSNKVVRDTPQYDEIPRRSTLSPAYNSDSYMINSEALRLAGKGQSLKTTDETFTYQGISSQQGQQWDSLSQIRGTAMYN